MISDNSFIQNLRLATTSGPYRERLGRGDNSIEALQTESLREAIKRQTGGNLDISQDITNKQSMTGLLNAYMRMKNYGSGNLIPDAVKVTDDSPKVYSPWGVQGWAELREGTKDNPDIVNVRSTGFGGTGYGKLKLDSSGEHVAKGVDAVSQHELAHAAQFAYDDAPYRYAQRLEDEASKYEKKYATSDLMSDAFSKIKYAIPKLFDSVFGTHIVPTEKEWKNMTDERVAKFWEDNFYPPLEKAETVADKMRKNNTDKITRLMGRYSPASFFEQAAKNTGFDNVEDANASISRYAGTNWGEAFAEAYSDVVLNKDKAKPYSKELIRLYSEGADKWNRSFSKDRPIQLEMLNQLLSVPEITKKAFEK